MKEPIRITLEAEKPHAAYVYYTREKWAESTSVLEDGGIVEVDLDVNGEVIGIEMIGIDDDIVAAAKAYADSRDLRFPTNWNERLAALRR